MALRAVYDHPKYRRLVKILRSEFAAMGVLELVWHFTAKFAPQGNIGKYSDSEIETWIGWDGEEGAAIGALVKCGWLDLDEEHRIVVHDWHQWADSEVHATLAKRTLRFLNGDMPKLEKTKLGGPTRARIRAAYAANGGHAGDSVPHESTDSNENDTNDEHLSPPGQSQSQSQSRSRSSARARDDDAKGRIPKTAPDDLTPPAPPGNDPPDMTLGTTLWEPFSRVPCFSNGSIPAQIEGLQEVGVLYQRHYGVPRLLDLARQCARHYAPNKVVLGNIKSAPNAFEKWIKKQKEIDERAAGEGSDGFQRV